MASRIMALAVRPLRFADWMFSPLAPSIDMLLMLFAGSWAAIELFHPSALRYGALVGLQWLPNPAWFAFHMFLATMHGFGLRRLHSRELRVFACFTSAWQWLVVAISIARVDITTTVLAYAILGAFALVGAIYLAGVPRRGT